MIPRFQKLRDIVYQLNVDLPVTYTELISLLSAETWSPEQIGYGQSNLQYRYRLSNPVNPILKHILDEISGPEFKKTIIDQLYRETSFLGLWGTSPEKMSALTVVYSGFVCDRPGHVIRIHTDDRMHVTQGMIYFVNSDDPDQATTFYTSKNHDDPLRITTGYGTGFMAANTNNGFHSGHNVGVQNRYSVIFGLRLNL